MNDLIQILEISQSRNGPDFPLTIGHLLNICKKAQFLKEKRIKTEEKEHNKLLNQISYWGQN